MNNENNTIATVATVLLISAEQREGGRENQVALFQMRRAAETVLDPPAPPSLRSDGDNADSSSDTDDTSNRTGCAVCTGVGW